MGVCGVSIAFVTLESSKQYVSIGDESGIRTRDEISLTATTPQRLKPLGHPAVLVRFVGRKLVYWQSYGLRLPSAGQYHGTACVCKWWHLAWCCGILVLRKEGTRGRVEPGGRWSVAVWKATRKSRGVETHR